MQAGLITVMSFLSFSILRKVKDENENDDTTEEIDFENRTPWY